MKRIKLFASLLAGSLLASVIWVAVAQEVSSTKETHKRPQGAWDQVNRTARNVKTGDRRAIQSLVDEVFLANGLDGYISASASSVKERLVSAEIDFQNGTGDGIETKNIATSINQLVENLKLPAYAATNVAEVNKVRLRMLTLYPDLIGRGSAAKRNNSRPSFAEKMSPVEAFHIAATLLRQKVFNPEFQLTVTEQQEISNRTKTIHQAKTTLAKETPVAPTSERTHEMITAIREAGKSMSFRDMLDQSEQSLDLLGIRR